MIRRVGTPAKLDRKYILRPGAYAVLSRGRDVLLTFQSQPEPEFQLPGGGIDPGEGPIQALHREVFEETGWAIDAPRKLGAFRRFAYMPEYDMWAEKLCHIYVARPVINRGPPLEPDHTAVWVSPSEAVEMVGNSGDQLFLEQFFDLGR